MGFKRVVERNVMKNWQKNNKIAEEWKKFQMNRYGIEPYMEMQKLNKKRK